MKNFTTPALTALLLAAGLTVGCDQSASDAMDKGKEMAGDAMDKGKEMAGDAMDKGKEMAGDAMDKGKEMAKEAMGGDMDMGKMAEGMSLSEEQATGMLDKIKDMISSGDTEGAGSMLEKLKGMELPEAVQPQVDKLVSMLEQAKGAGNALQNLAK